MILLTTIMVIVFIILLLYLIIIMPKLSVNPEFEKFNSYYFAHRGLFDNRSFLPENSCGAFREAVKAGYGIELDVQLSRDHKLIVFHDWDLQRMCGVNQEIENLTLKQLKSYSLLNTQEKIPTLQEVLQIINGKVPIIIELKSRRMNNKLYETVSTVLDEYTGVYCIESFNPKCVKWYKDNRPKIIRGQLSSNKIADKGWARIFINMIFKNLLFNFITKPDFIAYDIRAKNCIAFKICRKLYGVKTFAWTVRTDKEMEDNKKEFDYIIFDSFKPYMIK